MTREQLAYLIALVSILGTLFVAGSQWGDLRARITAAEDAIKDLKAEQRYIHGDIRVPKGE